MNYPKTLTLVCILLTIASCKSKDSSTSKTENDLDAARSFIRSTLDGKFDEARKYMYPDSVNFNYLAVAERIYKNISAEVKENYRASSINIHAVTPVNDSNTIIIFSNSFKNDHDTLRALKTKGNWLIDLKYLYEHDMDTTGLIHQLKDSLR